MHSRGDAAFLFSADGYSLRGTKLMGRQSAGAGFLRALTGSAGAGGVTAVLHQAGQAGALQAALAEAGWRGSARALATDQHEHIAAIGCLYLPTPGLGEFAWRRAAWGERGYSLCGVTHTIATHAVMSALAELPLAPLRSWDALICTSQAGRAAVQEVIGAQADYLRWRLGATRLELPQLPVIPLGVHCADYGWPDEERAAARLRLGVHADDVVVLFAGRLSFHAKAHPHPMLLALQRCAAARPGRRVHLVLAGQYANEAIRAAFDEARQVLAPQVVHHDADGGDARAWRTAWAAADVFTSLSDNVQETFGLTPIEAMAAGLPCVVSDWDGYRDTVRDGLDGLRVPTTLPPAGSAADFAVRHDHGQDNYDVYTGQLCQFVAVDVEAAQVAYGRLIDDAALRRRLGAQARERARASYDWAVIIGQYRELWARLADERCHARDAFGPLTMREAPARMDPTRMFARYATRVLGDDDRLALSAAPDAAAYEAVRELACHRYAQRVLPSHAQAAVLWQRWASQPRPTVGELLAGLPPAQARLLRRGLVWMLKTGWVRYA